MATQEWTIKRHWPYWYTSQATKIHKTKTQQRKLVNLVDCLQQYLVQYTYLSLKKIV
jgi:hypothetical protein